jgi:hypothetical protein
MRLESHRGGVTYKVGSSSFHLGSVMTPIPSSCGSGPVEIHGDFALTAGGSPVILS